MYNEIDFSATSVPRLVFTSLEGWVSGPQVLGYGAILIVRAGRARLRVNFTEWDLQVGAVITLFPNDVAERLPPPRPTSGRSCCATMPRC